MKVEEFVDLLPMPAMFVGDDLTLRSANAPLEAVLGAGLQGRHYMTVLRQPDLLARIEAGLARRTPGKARISLRTDGHSHIWQASVRPVTGGEGGGAPPGVLVVFEDVTPFEEARRMRSDFVANVSHELRTPLTALQGFIETLSGPARDDPQARARFLTVMAREAERMNRLIEDLLSLARVEDEERQRPTGTLDLCALLRDQMAALEPQAEKRGVALSLAGCSGPVRIAGDADQLRQVFANLVENAIKYGAEGGEVKLRLTRKSRLAGLRGPGVLVEVTDRGPGIAPHHLSRLTERFYRVDTHRSRNLGGTGLGLAIVKHIVSRHRGRLRITSKPGRGSTFTVMLPL